MDVAGYTDLDVVCRGGSSTVYRARQVAMDRPVALKVLDVALTDPAARERCRRECAAAGRVGSHPGIVTVYDSGFTDDGRPFLSMELCGGGSLAHVLRESGPLPVQRVLRIGVTISAALAYAHAAGVLHRDVKPGNILLTEFGEPVLSDFGIASLDGFALSTRTSASFTVAHAAPECLAGRASTRASDIYSLSSTLFALLSGHAPFEVPEDAGALALAVKVVDSPVPRLHGTGVPAGLAALLETGMAKQPGHRPIDAAVFGHELQRIQEDLGLAVTPWTIAPDPDPWEEPAAAPAQTGPPAAFGLPAAAPAAFGLPAKALAQPAAASAPTGASVTGQAATPPASEARPVDPERRGNRTASAPRVVAPAAGLVADPMSSLPTDPVPAGAVSPGTRRNRGWLLAASVLLLVLVGAGTVVYGLTGNGEPAARADGPGDAAVTQPSSAEAAAGVHAAPAAANSTAQPPVITALSGPGSADTVDCPSPHAVVTIRLTWRASNASTAWLAMDSGPDASVHPLRAGLPTSVGPHNPARHAEPVPFDCSARSHRYTLTVLGPGGKISRSLVYTAQRAPGTTAPIAEPAADRPVGRGRAPSAGAAGSPARNSSGSNAPTTPGSATRPTSGTVPGTDSPAPSTSISTPGGVPFTTPPPPATVAPARSTAPPVGSPAPVTSAPPSSTAPPSPSAPPSTTQAPTTSGGPSTTAGTAPPTTGSGASTAPPTGDAGATGGSGH